MEEQYPLWLLIHLFPDFSAKNGNEDVLIWEYFGFSHALHFLLAIFGIHLRCTEFSTLFPFEPLILTPPAKIVDNCLPLQFCPRFFPYALLTSLAIWKTKKLPVGTVCWSSFIFGNVRSEMPEQTPWWHRAKKTRGILYVLFRPILKSVAGAVHYCRLGVDYIPEPEFFPTQLYALPEILETYRFPFPTRFLTKGSLLCFFCTGKGAKS